MRKLLRKEYRDAYLSSRVKGLIAYQIQAIRRALCLTQTDFAERIGKKQAVVSRLENSEYGRVTVQTLLDIASALDMALLVRFVSYPEFLRKTSDVSDEALRVESIYDSVAKATAPESAPNALAAWAHDLKRYDPVPSSTPPNRLRPVLGSPQLFATFENQATSGSFTQLKQLGRITN